jgi:hypothetical protein
MEYFQIPRRHVTKTFCTAQYFSDFSITGPGSGLQSHSISFYSVNLDESFWCKSSDILLPNQAYNPGRNKCDDVIFSPLNFLMRQQGFNLINLVVLEGKRYSRRELMPSCLADWCRILSHVIISASEDPEHARCSASRVRRRVLFEEIHFSAWLKWLGERD